MPVSSHDQSNTAAAIRYIEQAFGLKSYGWREQGSVPNSDHPKGLAVDVLTADRALGDRIADWFLKHADAFGTTYVIWQGRIANPGGPWRAYTGPNPHTDHVHISFRQGGGIGAGIPIGSTTASPAGGGLVDQVVQPLLGGARRTVLTVTFTGLGLTLIGLGAWRGIAYSARQAN